MDRVKRVRDWAFEKVSQWAHAMLGEVYVSPTPSEQKIRRDAILKKLRRQKNFADTNSGASVLYASSNISNKGAILVPKEDTYMTHTNCQEHNLDEVIINLSDDVRIDTILVTNHEDFSA